MTLDEYLEKLMAEAYKRELDKEENIVRSLPFFGTALAFVAASLGAIHAAVPAPSCSAYAIGIWAIIALLAAAITSSLVFLIKVVKFRRFKYMSNEDEILTFVEKLKVHYAATATATTADQTETANGLSGDNFDAEIISDLRQHLIAGYSKAAPNNREILTAREIARGRAILSLFIAIALTFLLIAGTFPNRVP